MKRLLVALAMLVACSGRPDPTWAENLVPQSTLMMGHHRLRIGDYIRAWPATEGPAPGTTAEGTAAPGANAAATPPAGPAPVEGPIVGFSATTFTVARSEDAALVDLTTARRLEVRQRHAHYRRGAIIGGALGLLAGAFLITDELVGHKIDAWERAAWMTGLTAGGSMLGLGVARLTRKDTWEPLDLVTLRPHAADAGPALRLSLTLRF